jgi:diacylglycerol kinase family enzyme
VQAGVELVVAVGGDGTVNAVVNGLVGSRCRLGILPTGTANDLATSVGLPRQLADACQVILQGAVRNIDVIRVNAWHFITSGGVGLPVDVLETVDDLRGRTGPGRRCARLLGSGLYPISMLYHLIRGVGQARNVELQLDGRRISLRVQALLVSNLRSTCASPRTRAPRTASCTYSLWRLPDRVPLWPCQRCARFRVPREGMLAPVYSQGTS